MESSTETGSVTSYRSTRSRANSASSENLASPSTSRQGRITRGKSQETEKLVSTPMPRKKSLKNLSVNLTKLKFKLNSVEANADENVIKEEVISDEEKLQSTEVLQNGSKEKKCGSIVPDHLDTQQSIANSNLPDARQSKFVELSESISYQGEPAAVERATKWRQTLGGTIDLSTENEDESELVYTPTGEGTPQMILEKLPSAANNDAKELPTVNPSESSAAQLNNQSGSVSSNQNDILIQAGAKYPIIDSIQKSNGTNTTPIDTEFSKDFVDAIHQNSDGKHIDDNLGIGALVAEVATSPQSTKPTIGQNDEMEKSVTGDERDRANLFSDGEAEKAIQKDSMDVTIMDENEISDAGILSGSDVVNVHDSEVSFTVSESSIDFLASDRNDSDVNQKRPNSSEEDVSNELENLETQPKKILKSKRLSDEMAVSKDVKKRMSLHPNLKLKSGKLKTSDVLDEGVNVIMASKESFDSIQHGRKTEEEFRGSNRSHSSDEDEYVFKDEEKIPLTKSSKRHSDEMLVSKEISKRLSLHPNVKLSSGQTKKQDVSDAMPVSKEVSKRLSLHPNVKLSSGQMKKRDVSDEAHNSKIENVEASIERQSKQHSEISNAQEDDAANELENLSANPENIKKSSRRLSDSVTILRHKFDFKRINLHPSTLLQSSTGSLANSSLVKCDPKECHHVSKASSMNNSDSNDSTEAMEVDQFVTSSETSNKHTSSDSNNETTQQLKQKKFGKLKAKKEGVQGKQTALTAVPFRRKKNKKSQEIPEADINAIKKALVHRNFLLSKHATESKIITTKVSQSNLKRKVDAISDEDDSSIIKPKMKKQKIVQALESSTPKIQNKKRYPTQQLAAKLNPKKNLKVRAKKFLPKLQWTTAGPFMVKKIPTNKDSDVLLSTSHFTVTSLSGSNFSFSSFKDGSTIHFQSSVGKR